MATDIDVIAFGVVPRSLEGVQCPACDGPMTLHQPDQQSPHRLLGFCEGCSGWYLMVVRQDISDVVMVVLPDNEWFKAIWDAQESLDLSDPP